MAGALPTMAFQQPASRITTVRYDLGSDLFADFDLLSYSHKKEYVKWVTGAKKEETRARRIEKAIAMLPKRKTPMG